MQSRRSINRQTQFGIHPLRENHMRPRVQLPPQHERKTALHLKFMDPSLWRHPNHEDRDRAKRLRQPYLQAKLSFVDVAQRVLDLDTIQSTIFPEQKIKIVVTFRPTPFLPLTHAVTQPRKLPASEGLLRQKLASVSKQMRELSFGIAIDELQHSRSRPFVVSKAATP